MADYQPLFCFLFLALLYHNILLNYGYMDDYALLWKIREYNGNFGGKKEVFDLMLQGGRFLLAVLNRFFFSLAYDVDNLKYLRVIGLLGALCCSCVLFRFFLWLKWDTVNAFFFSLLFLTTPSFALYISWAITCTVPWAFLFSICAGILVVGNFGLGIRFSRFLNFSASVFLLQCSLLIYQPAVTGFFIPVTAYLLAFPQTGYRELLTVLCRFLFSLLVYMGIFTVGLSLMGLEKSARAQFSPHMLRSFFSFYFDEFRHVFSLNYVFWGKGVKTVAMVTGGVFCCGFLLAKIRDMVKGRMSAWVLGFLVFVFPLTYLPTIASSNDWICYRALAATITCFLIYIIYAIGKINGLRLKRWLVFFFSCSMVVSCYHNTNNYFILLHEKEYQKIYKQIKHIVHQNPEDITIIRPKFNSLSKTPIFDEYGIPSNLQTWVVFPFFNLVVEKETGVVNMVDNPETVFLSNQIRLNVYHSKKKSAIPLNERVIDIKEILESP